MIEFLHGIQRENNTVKPDEQFQQASTENLKQYYRQLFRIQLIPRTIREY